MVTEEIEMAIEEKEEDHELKEEGVKDVILSQWVSESEPKSSVSVAAELGRKDRRKALKKDKRKQKRKEAAEKARQEEEARLNDPEEQRRIQLEEEMDKERLERERREYEEKERLFLEALAGRKAQEEEERRRGNEAQKHDEDQVEGNMETNEDDEWDYVEEGPPEIIWQGNEIIVKKNKVRVKKKVVKEQNGGEDCDRPTSNPLLPQSEAFADFKNASMLSAQQLLENVAQQVPNFGTEQDKAHCPFHLKTGACRFGTRCSRVHFYPDKSCTLLIKNMYNGPGLAWEQDEVLEYTDEEVDRAYEEFYEDVHTEFLKFGEIINFKVCRNGSHHLRGNVYVHYASLDAAVLAYHAVNGRYFAGKQVSCEFVGVTRWRVAICGEYKKSKLKTCSRGTACNFMHCFHNPGGDYEWADWDKPPPKYWVRKMVALFGYSHEYGQEKGFELETPGHHGNSSKRYDSRRSRSTDIKSSNKSPRDHYEKQESQSNKHSRRRMGDDALRPEVPDERHYGVERYSTSHGHDKKRHRENSESDRDSLDRYDDADRSHDRRKTSRRHHYERVESFNSRGTRRSGSLDTLSDSDRSDRGTDRQKNRAYRKRRSRKQVLSGPGDNGDYSCKKRSYSTDSSREPLSSKDRLHQKVRTSDSDSSDEITQSRRHARRRKSPAHRNEASELSSDHQDSEKSLVEKRQLERSKSNPDYPDEEDESIDVRGLGRPDDANDGETHKKRRRKSHGKKSRSHRPSKEHDYQESKSRPSKAQKEE